MLVAGPGPARNLAERVQLVVAGGHRVLPGDLGSELEVLAYGLAKGTISGHLGLVERLKVQLHETSPLCFGDLQAAVNLDEVSEAELPAKAVRAPKGLAMNHVRCST